MSFLQTRSAWRAFRVAHSQFSSFHSTSRCCVEIGDQIPNVDLMEDSPGNKVNLSKVLASTKGLIIGVPAAFSPGCSESHIPGYMKHEKLEQAGEVFVVAVNDAFVTKAWSRALHPRRHVAAPLRFLADPHLAFTRALGLDFDAAAIFGGDRSKRYALCVRDGRVVKAFVEPDNTGIRVSKAEEVLQHEW